MNLTTADPLPWSRSLELAYWSAWLWVPLTVFALWVADRWPLDRENWTRRIPIYSAASLGVCGFRAIVVMVFNPWAQWYPELPGFREVLVTSLANNLLLFWMLLGVGHALAYARRFHEGNEQLTRAELHALKMQLHPHFLFNALNTVSVHIRSDPDAAERMISRIAQLLRHALTAGTSQEVPLEDELRVARAYLEIEQVRFAGRLNVRWAVDPDTHAARVPSLVLQPLVENAVRHGIAPRAAGGMVEIIAERRGTMLHLAVTDDGVGMSKADSIDEGVGIANTRARLRHLYGAGQSFEVGAMPSGGVRAELKIPFQPAERLARC